jgi:hypothetical protein
VEERQALKFRAQERAERQKERERKKLEDAGEEVPVYFCCSFHFS